MVPCAFLSNRDGESLGALDTNIRHLVHSSRDRRPSVSLGNDKWSFCDRKNAIGTYRRIYGVNV